MPERPTEVEVRDLMRKYGDEPPESPQCKQCAKPMYISEMNSDGCEFACRCGATERIPRERPLDAEVVELCEDWLRMRALQARVPPDARTSAELFKHQEGLIYKCSKCGAENCKLWRQYQTFLNHIELLCLTCAADDQGKKIVSVSDKDIVVKEDSVSSGTDQIGWLVPAVPTDDGSFWGYTSIPQDRLEWWKSLPSKPNQQEAHDA